MSGTTPRIAPRSSPPTRSRAGSRVARRLLTGPALTAAVTLAATAGALLPATAAPARVQPGVTCGYAAPVVEPTFVPVSCGDGSAFAIHVRWTYLSRTVGRARGIYLLDDCIPDCAYGRYHAYGARLSFSRVRSTAGLPYFTRVRIAFTTRQPNGRPVQTASYGPFAG